jgi:hypothetical protein
MHMLERAMLACLVFARCYDRLAAADFTPAPVIGAVSGSGLATVIFF